MEDLKTNEDFNLDNFLNDYDDNLNLVSNVDESSYNNTESTSMIEYKEIEEPCVALTIIGENKLTDAEVFVRRGIKYSIKAFFSAIVLTIMNLFI